MQDATAEQLKTTVRRTSEREIERYSANRDWKCYPKEWIYRNLPISGRTILDFGCGTGEITTQLALLGAERVIALDVTPGLLDITHRRAELDGVAARVETVCGYLKELEPQEVDGIVAYAVLHHCHPLADLIPSLLRWLRPGGWFVCVEPFTGYGWLEWLRDRSGIPGDPKDEGERKLNRHDVKYICSQLDDPQVTPFHLTSRLERIIGHAPSLRRLDSAIFGSLPTTASLAGILVISGQKRGPLEA